jgi:hypothetical protein
MCGYHVLWIGCDKRMIIKGDGLRKQKRSWRDPQLRMLVMSKVG